MEITTSNKDRLIKELTHYQSAFRIALSIEVLERLGDYYDRIERQNALLHLVAPCPPEEFATRHILESLTLLEHLPLRARFADVGAGAGLPSIPCLIVREDLTAVLIESKPKKMDFLAETLGQLDLNDRAGAVNKQFSETVPDANARYVTCRALDKFTSHVRRLVAWSGDRTMLFFGGEALGERLTSEGLHFGKELMPLSERRYLFSINGAANARR